MLSFCIMLFSPLLYSFAGNNTFALDINTSNEEIEQVITNNLKDFIEYGSVDKQREARIAGSKAEYNSALYIASKLAEYGLEAKNNASTVDGLEYFEFENIYTGNTNTSQNVIFTKRSNVASNKKVILSTHYDSLYVAASNGEYSSANSLGKEGVNDNAASVATLLAIASYISQADVEFGFDIEIVFFGAGHNNYAGSKYYSGGISEADKDNILLMLNLDRIGLGAGNYVYMGEFLSKGHYNLFDVLNTSNSISFLPLNNLVKYQLSSPSGLSYTHIGLEGDHAILQKRGINIINYTSGDYQKPLTADFTEFAGKQNITGTKNDNYDYILSNVKGFSDNLVSVYNSVLSLIGNDNFMGLAEKLDNMQGSYSFWNNKKLAVFITSIILVVFIFVYYLIYFHLQKVSRNKASASDINAIVIKITSNMPDQDEEIGKFINKKLNENIKGEEDEENKKED